MIKTMNRMKKHILFGGMLLCAAAFSSCNEDFDNWASPQSNAQGEAAAAYSIKVSPGSQANVVMDNAGETVNIVSVSYEINNLKSITLKSMTIDGKSLDYTYNDGTVTVNAAKLDSLVELATLDRSATPHEVTVKTEWAVQLTSGEAFPTEAETTVRLTPYSSTPEIDAKGYALLGDWQGWNSSNPTWMTEIEPGVYQAVVMTTKEENWFKFYKGSGFDEASFPWDAVALGCAENGEDTTPNLLAWENDPRFGGFQTPILRGEGQYVITLDMNKFCYKYEPKETKYYVVGDAQGWSPDNKTCLFYAMGSNQYTYTTKWTNQWSLKIWDQDNFGNWDVAWGGENGSTAATGTLTNSNAGAFGPNENGGWYTLVFNMGTKTYEWTAIEEPTTEYTAISVIGGFNNWSDEGELDLTQLEKAPHNWYARHTITTDTELKFRANHKWETNWGGDGSAAIDEDTYYVNPGNSNIIVPAGTYDFYLNDITGRWSIAYVAE